MAAGDSIHNGADIRRQSLLEEYWPYRETSADDAAMKEAKLTCKRPPGQQDDVTQAVSSSDEPAVQEGIEDGSKYCGDSVIEQVVHWSLTKPLTQGEEAPKTESIFDEPETDGEATDEEQNDENSTNEQLSKALVFDLNWPVKDLCELQEEQAMSIENLPSEIQYNILAQIIDRQDRVDVNISSDWLSKNSAFRNGIPQAFADLKGLLGTNRYFRKLARDWVFMVACFVTGEWEFHKFPAAFGIRNAREVRHLHIDLDVCNYYDRDRSKLLDMLVTSLPELECLELREKFTWPSDQVKPVNIVGGRHKSMRLAASICKHHPKLERLFLLPDTATDEGFVTTYRLDRVSKDIRQANWKAISANSINLKERPEAMAPNATAIRHRNISVLRRSTFKDLSIHLRAGQSLNDITTSEVPDLGSHYDIMDEYGLKDMSYGDDDFSGSQDQWLFDICDGSAKSPYPVAHLSHQVVKLKLELNDAKREQQATNISHLILQRKLDDRERRLTEIGMRASIPWIGKRKMRQARKHLAYIVKVSQTAATGLDKVSENIPNEDFDAQV